MDGISRAKALVAQLADAIGLPALAFDEDGTLVLQIEERLPVFLGVEKDGTALTILAPLPDSEGPKPAAFLLDLLAANFMWKDTDGATLALDGTTGPVTLIRRLPLAGLDYPDFETELNRFVDSALAWSKRAAVAKVAGRLDDGESDAEPAAEEAAAASDSWVRV